jgi:hypothetical protein
LTIREDLGDQLYPGEDEYYSTLRPLKATGAANKLPAQSNGFLQNGEAAIPNRAQSLQNYVQIVDDPMYMSQDS